MLKIKDTVDLKELEKLGFEESCDCYLKHTANAYWFVRKRDRIIGFSTNYGEWTRILLVLFDLISAGLVEKVEE